MFGSRSFAGTCFKAQTIAVRFMAKDRANKAVKPGAKLVLEGGEFMT